MQDRTEIIRNPAALNYQLVFFSITFLVLAVVCIFVLIVPFTVFDRHVLLWFSIFTGIAIAFYALSIWMISKFWYSNRYYFAKDCLIVTAGFGSIREDIYRYETIANISLQQNRTEKVRGYARLVLSVADNQQPVVLKDVIRANEVLETLQNRVIAASRATTIA